MVGHTRNNLRAMLLVFGSVAVCACLPTLIFASPQAGEASANEVQSAPADSTARPDEKSGVIEFRVLDVQTGYSIKAKVTYDEVQDGWTNPVSQATDEEGRVRLKLPPGDYLFEVTSVGYERARLHIPIAAATKQPLGVNLSPDSMPQELQADVLDAKLRPGITLVCGYVVDDETRKPLEGATVRVVKAGVEVKTNQRGYYEVSVPSPPGTVIEGAPLPGMDDLIISSKGYRTYVGRNLDFPDDDTAGLNVALVRGRGEIVKDYTHKLRRPPKGKEGQTPPTDSTASPDETTGVIDYRIRDSETGYAVQATVKYATVEEGWGNPRSATTDEHGRIRLELPPAHYLIEISAPGYPPLRTDDQLTAGEHSAGQIMMPPLTPPEELRPEVMERKLFQGYGLWQGYVVDAVTFKPLSGARVSLEKAQLETRTNERGYFSISAPVVDPKGPFPGPPVMDTMIIELAGYKTRIEKNEIVPAEHSYVDFRLELEPGQGTTIHDNTPAPLREDYGHHQSAGPGRTTTPTPEDLRVLKWLSEKPGR